MDPQQLLRWKKGRNWAILLFGRYSRRQVTKIGRTGRPLADWSRARPNRLTGGSNANLNDK